MLMITFDIVDSCRKVLMLYETKVYLTSVASWTSVVDVKVRVALFGSIAEDDPELLNEIVVLDADGNAVGKPGMIPIDWWYWWWWGWSVVGGNKLVSLSGIFTFSSVHFEGRYTGLSKLMLCNDLYQNRRYNATITCNLEFWNNHILE